MLSIPPQLGPPHPTSSIRLSRKWKTASAAEAVAFISPRTTVAVGWLSDPLATALSDAFITGGQPNDLTIVYASTRGDGRIHGLNLLARAGLVRRVIGGQWHPVPALQALASANQIEAYSLPAGAINRLFRDIAEGLPGHLSRSGLGTFIDPRNGGGRLNPRTREHLVRLVRPAGDEALLFRGFPVDVALIGVAFLEGSAAITATRDSLTIARAARMCGGLVIAQIDHIGTLNKVPSGYTMITETMVDILIEADPRERRFETFALPDVR